MKKLIAPQAFLKGLDAQEQRAVAGYLDEINKRIDALTAENTALAARVTDLETRVTTLEGP